MSQTESRESRSGECGSDREQGSSAVEEIASKMLRIQNKRYYVDVKQNSRGKFIKLVEERSWQITVPDKPRTTLTVWIRG